MSDNEKEFRTQDKEYAEPILSHLARYSTRVPIPVLLAALLIAALAYRHENTPLIAVWVCCVLTMLLCRRYVLSTSLPKSKLSTKNKINVAILLSLSNGSVHAFSLFFFPWLSDFERAIQTLVLAGLSTGAIGTTLGHSNIYSAYVLPVMGGLLLAWFYNAYIQDFEWVFLSVVLLIALFTAVLNALAKDTYRQFHESYSIRKEQITLNDQLRDALVVAESANKEKTRFLAAASHDLRQPIHALSLLSASISMRSLDEKTMHITELMNLAISSLADQMDALLDISKLDAGVVDVNYEIVDLSQLIQRIAEQYSIAAKEKSLKYKLNCEASIWTRTDPVLLERIVQNLVSNAIRYTSKGDVSLTLEVKANDKILIAIDDTGAGISQHHIDSIFEEFYQVNNPERDRQKGLGLGLAIVKRLSHLLKIELSVQSQLDHGSRFSLLLDKALPEIPAGKDFKDQTFSWEGLKILVVDDERMVRQATRAVLSELDAEVKVEDSTEGAVLLATNWRPDLLMVDYRLKGEDSGLDTILAFKQLWPECKAILISGDTEPQRLREVRALNIPFLHKPISILDLQRVTSSFYADDLERKFKKQNSELDSK